MNDKLITKHDTVNKIVKEHLMFDNTVQSMYSNTSNLKITKTMPENVEIVSATNNMYILDIKGQKIKIASIESYNTLHNNVKRLKSDCNRLYQENKRAIDSIKVLIKAIKDINIELSQKVDKYESDI